MKRLLISVAAAAVCASAAAEGIEFKLSGFGTIGGVKTNTDEAEYRASGQEAKGASKKIDFGVDSRLGVQGDLKFNDTFSAVGQLLSRRTVSSEGLPEVEWLYGQAELPAGFKLKLGRIVLPTFLLSDSRAVGYTQFWTRTPNEVYLQYGNTHFNGGQLQYNRSLGPVNLTAQFSAGDSKADYAYFGVLHTEYKDLRSLALTAEYGNWLARFAETRSYLNGFGPVLKDRFDAYGLQYDNGTLVGMAEYIKRTVATFGFDTKAYTIAGGWRFGNWTPYVQTSYARVINSPKSSTQALGLRWDPIKNVDVKIQAAKVIGGADSFTAATPEFLAARPAVHVFSLGIDFVF